MSLKRENFSELQVLQSAAGYFIGRLYWDEEFSFWDMGSRESDYFPTQEAAHKALDAGFEVRECPENMMAYTNGSLPLPR